MANLEPLRPNSLEASDSNGCSAVIHFHCLSFPPPSVCSVLPTLHTGGSQFRLVVPAADFPLRPRMLTVRRHAVHRDPACNMTVRRVLPKRRISYLVPSQPHIADQLGRVPRIGCLAHFSYITTPAYLDR